MNITVIIYEPTFKEDSFFNSKIIVNLREFKKLSDLIITNRMAAVETSLDDALDLEVKTQRAAAATSDFTEGVRAFVEKRPAVFTGR